MWLYKLVDFVTNKNAKVREDAPLHPSMNHPTLSEKGKNRPAKMKIVRSAPPKDWTV